MDKKVDTLDSDIIRLLEQDAWQSSQALARQLHVSSATIRRRLKKLRAVGAVRAVAIPDPTITGIPLTIILGLTVELKNVNPVMKAITDLPEVRWAATTTGRFDAIALARFHSTSEFSEFVRQKLTGVDGIRQSETFVFLDVERGNSYSDS